MTKMDPIAAMEEVDEHIGWRQIDRTPDDNEPEDQIMGDSSGLPSTSDLPTPVIQCLLIHYTHQSGVQPGEVPPYPRYPPMDALLGVQERRAILRTQAAERKARNAIQKAAERRSIKKIQDFGLVSKAFAYEVDKETYGRVLLTFDNIMSDEKERVQRAKLLKFARCRQFVRRINFASIPSAGMDDPERFKALQDWVTQALAFIADCPNLEVLYISHRTRDTAVFPAHEGDRPNNRVALPVAQHPVIANIKSVSTRFPSDRCVDFLKILSLKALTIDFDTRATINLVLDGPVRLSQGQYSTRKRLEYTKHEFVMFASHVTDVQLKFSFACIQPNAIPWCFEALGHLMFSGMQRIVLDISGVGDSYDFRRLARGWDDLVNDTREEAARAEEEEERAVEIPNLSQFCKWLYGRKPLTEIEINIVLLRNNTKWKVPEFLPSSSALLAMSQDLIKKCPSLQSITLIVGKEPDHVLGRPQDVNRNGILPVKKWKQTMRRWEARPHTIPEGERIVMVEVDYTATE